MNLRANDMNVPVKYQYDIFVTTWTLLSVRFLKTIVSFSLFRDVVQTILRFCQTCTLAGRDSVELLRCDIFAFNALLVKALDDRW